MLRGRLGVSVSVGGGGGGGQQYAQMCSPGLEYKGRGVGRSGGGGKGDGERERDGEREGEGSGIFILTILAEASALRRYESRSASGGWGLSIEGVRRAMVVREEGRRVRREGRKRKRERKLKERERREGAEEQRRQDGTMQDQEPQEEPEDEDEDEKENREREETQAERNARIESEDRELRRQQRREDRQLSRAAAISPSKPSKHTLGPSPSPSEEAEISHTRLAGRELTREDRIRRGRAEESDLIEHRIAFLAEVAAEVGVEVRLVWVDVGWEEVLDVTEVKADMGMDMDGAVGSKVEEVMREAKAIGTRDGIEEDVEMNEDETLQGLELGEDMDQEATPPLPSSSEPTATPPSSSQPRDTPQLDADRTINASQEHVDPVDADATLKPDLKTADNLNRDKEEPEMVEKVFRRRARIGGIAELNGAEVFMATSKINPNRHRDRDGRQVQAYAACNNPQHNHNHRQVSPPHSHSQSAHAACDNPHHDHPAHNSSHNDSQNGAQNPSRRATRPILSHERERERSWSPVRRSLDPYGRYNGHSDSYSHGRNDAYVKDERYAFEELGVQIEEDIVPDASVLGPEEIRMRVPRTATNLGQKVTEPDDSEAGHVSGRGPPSPFKIVIPAKRANASSSQNSMTSSPRQSRDPRTPSPKPSPPIRKPRVETSDDVEGVIQVDEDERIDDEDEENLVDESDVEDAQISHVDKGKGKARADSLNDHEIIEVLDDEKDENEVIDAVDEDDTMGEGDWEDVNVWGEREREAKREVEMMKERERKGEWSFGPSCRLSPVRTAFNWLSLGCMFFFSFLFGHMILARY